MCSRKENGILVYDPVRVREIARKKRLEEIYLGAKKPNKQTDKTVDPFYSRRGRSLPLGHLYLKAKVSLCVLM